MPKITPKQAFDAIKVLYPDSIGIARTGDPETVELLPPNETPSYARMKFYAAVEIDWGTQTQYPTTVYRDPTPQDAINGVQAEFSSHSDFRNPIAGELTGWVTDKKATWWYRLHGIDEGAISYVHCRIPVPAPEPAPPEGWEVITDAHKKRWMVCSNGYADIYTTDGKILKRCFYASDHPSGEYRWREFGVGWIDNPKCIREHKPH